MDGAGLLKIFIKFVNKNFKINNKIAYLKQPIVV